MDDKTVTPTNPPEYSAPSVDLNSPQLYINRELSLLAFNQRVLELGFDPHLPLLERLRYLCISSTNLDEFYEIRASGLKQQVAHGINAPGPDGISAREQLNRIAERAHALVDRQYRLFNEELVPTLAKESIHFVRRAHWNLEQAEWVRHYFHRELLPVLSPLGLDPAHPFPRILNKSLNFVVTLEGKDAFGRDSGIALVQAPRSLSRLIQMPTDRCSKSYCLVFLSSIIHAHVNTLFPGMQVTGCYQFRVTRNTDLFVDEEEINDLKRALEGELPSRNYGEAVRLEVADNCPPETTNFLLHQFGLEEEDLYQVNGPVNLNRLAAVIDLVDRLDLKFPAFTPKTPKLLEDANLFDILERQDILLHHPFQSFNPIIEFLRQAAEDPDVLAIKMAIYRTGTQSRIVDHLEMAARAGKEVTAVIELRAHPGMQVTGCYQFRVTRNTDLFVDEEEINDLKRALEGELPSRNYGEAVRLEVADNCPPETTNFLLHQFGLEEEDLYQVNGPVNLNRLAAVIDLVDRLDLKFPAFTPKTPKLLEDANLFDILERQDILLHHPFQSFNPIIEFLRQAAEDPDVLAIKMAIYRTGTQSRIVDHLEMAARAGKEVTAVIELRARFDEENNIRIAGYLQDAGAHVVYGVVGYKTHAKMLLVVRRRKGRIRRYVHLGTGNYHPGTARAYTDLGLLTADRIIGEDVHKIFQQLTGLGKAGRLKKLLEAPFSLHKKLLAGIKREIAAARGGKEARIIARMNALIEPQIIQALYQASRAGVQIDLIVRGICALRPGVPGVSDNIRVRSIMGRFLEHSRVFYFQNPDGEPKLYASSADWMPRNFFCRVEVAFPLENRNIAQRVKQETLDFYLEDNCQAWELHSDGTYQRIKSGRQKRRSAQERLLELLGELPLRPESRLR